MAYKVRDKVRDKGFNPQIQALLRGECLHSHNKLKTRMLKQKKEAIS
jgi:hypothetical protein